MKQIKVILELYMGIWYCYNYENGSTANPLFTSTSYGMAHAEAQDASYKVVEVIHDSDGKLFLDKGDFDRTGEPDELYIRVPLEGEEYDICSFGCNDTNFSKDYAEALVHRYNTFPTMMETLKENEELKERCRVLTEALQETYDVLWMHTQEITKCGYNPTDAINKAKSALNTK
jgi:hypothetical protein